MSIRLASLRRLLALITTALTTLSMPAATVADFASRAEKQEPLTVVFLGGSLTWGANASDPNVTSYRGRMMTWLRDRYPRTAIRFHDAAIGGTGSALALFRLDRDVLARKPDLVFIDFTVNDDLGTADAHGMAAYEHIIRELRSDEIAVIPVLMCVKGNITDSKADIPARYAAHRKIADAYGLVAGDTLGIARKAVTEGRCTAGELYPIGRDTTHPGDLGYELFFEAARDAYLEGAASAGPSYPPAEYVTEDRYPFRERKKLSDMQLPAGWDITHTYRTSMWFDGLSSRWMDEVGRATAGAGAIETTFRGSYVALIGERSVDTALFRVWIDGKPVPQTGSKADAPTLWNITTQRFGTGAAHLFGWTLLAKNLADGEHTLRIEPVFDDQSPNAELRIESICSAGR